MPTNKKVKTLKDTTDEIIDTVEDTLGDKLAVEDNGDQIWKTLDRALVLNRRIKRNDDEDPLNVLFIGDAGTGKTARIKAWAKARGVHLVSKMASSMDDGDVGGAIRGSADDQTVVKLSATEFDELDTVKDSVLFLDELNRAPKSVRATLLTLVQNHTIPDYREKGQVRKLKEFLFTIVAVNPSVDDSYDTDILDMAERSRFKRQYVYADPKVTMKYLVGKYEQSAKSNLDHDDKEGYLEDLGRIALTKRLLGSSQFTFDNPQSLAKSLEKDEDVIALTARTFTEAMGFCDGTKASFIEEFSACSNPDKLPMIKAILADYEDPDFDAYEDIDDKANAALNIKNFVDGTKAKPKAKKAPKKEPEKKVFGDGGSELRDKLAAKLARL